MVPISEIKRLDDKDFLPEKYETWEVTKNISGEVIQIIGDRIYKDKTIENISTGYVYYFRTDEGLKRFSAFHHSVKKI